MNKQGNRSEHISRLMKTLIKVTVCKLCSATISGNPRNSSIFLQYKWTDKTSLWCLNMDTVLKQSKVSCLQLFKKLKQNPVLSIATLLKPGVTFTFKIN